MKSASQNPLELYYDPATLKVKGDGQCEWCGQILHNHPARWFADEKGYILECRSDCLYSG